MPEIWREKMNFVLNQIFENVYPPEAAAWCNENNAFIAEIEPKGGKRIFQIVAIPAPTEEELKAEELEKAKAERAVAVEKITVEVDGMVFDGDETSQQRMSRTISAAIALGVDLDGQKQVWVLADNSVAQPTIRQLAEALRLAGEKQTELWTMPYEG